MNMNKLPTSIDAATAADSASKNQPAKVAATTAKLGKLSGGGGGSQRKLLMHLSSTTDSVDLEEFEIDLTTDDDEAVAVETAAVSPLSSSSTTSLKTPLIKTSGTISTSTSKDERGKKSTTKTTTATATAAAAATKAPARSEGGNQRTVANLKIENVNDDDDEDDEEDEDDICETTRFSKSSSSPLNTAPPITIGKIKIFNPGRRRRALRLRRLLKRFLCVTVVVLALLFLLYNIDRLPAFASTVFGWLMAVVSTGDGGGGEKLRGGKDGSSRCSQVVSRPVWRTNFPLLTVESALRMVDVNNDTVLDVIVPFGSGIDAAYYDATLCQIYFNQSEMESKTIGCGGGVMAVDGTSGVLLWSLATAHELFASNCNLDINGDGVKDCVFGGRMASLYAVDGRTGAVFWSITSTFGEPVAETSNFYTALLVPKDVDGDGLADLVVMHGGDPLRAPGARVRNVARLMVLSAKTGAILSWAPVPDGAESYYSPQLLVHPDGTALVLFGTGGETHPGGLYVVALDALLSAAAGGSIRHRCRTLLLDCCKGFISPPVLVDLTGDGVLDIVLAAFNASALALDGLTFEVLWRRAFPGGETYSSPAVGYFNDDGVPDFAVSYQFGPGFPIYFYAEFHVLDGRTGEELLSEKVGGLPVRMPIGTQSSPLTVSTGAANDAFLFWYSGCSNGSLSQKSNNTTDELSDNGPFQISPGATVHDSSRADFCRLRFGDQARQYTQFRAITLHSSTTFYDSRTDEPPVSLMNATAIAYQWYADNVGGGQEGGGDTGGQSAPGDNSNLVDGRGGVWGPLDPAAAAAAAQVPNSGSAIRDQPVVFTGGGAFDQLRKYKKMWPPLQEQSGNDDSAGGGGGGQFADNQQQQQQQQQPYLKRKRRKRSSSSSDDQQQRPRAKRHVGLHNGDSVQRVISTGTLAPSLVDSSSSSSFSSSSIDVLFATYSFPPAANVKLMSAAMRRCIAEYMAPEREAQLRLLDDSSPFRRLGYDHDAYEAAVKDICARENAGDGAGAGGGGTGGTGDADSEPGGGQQNNRANVDGDPVKANDWIRQMGSMTLHRVTLKCYDQSGGEGQKSGGGGDSEEKSSGRAITIKEYLHQWWPGYLGLFADCIANMLDE